MNIKDEQKTDIVEINDVAQQLDEQTMTVATEIIQEEDLTKLKDLTHLFNLQHTKKQVIRTLQYDKLLDNITSQIEERVSKRADQFSNKELLDYMNVMTTSLEKAQKQVTSVDEAPLITLNQQNNTVIIGDNLSRESRRKVTSIVDAILAKINSQEPENTESTSVYYNEEDISSDQNDTSCTLALNEEDE